MSELSKKIRVEWLEADTKRNKGLTKPKSINAVKNISYGDGGEWNLLDLYLPDGKKNLPVIVSFHGGGYVYGTKEIYQFYLMDLARRGFAVINFNYRLAPEFQFPSALEDANNVFKWIFENAPKYNFDVDNIFMVGDSAGAHYTALYSLLTTNPDYAEKIGIFPLENLKLKAVALNCGRYDIDDDFKTPGQNHNELLEDLLGPDFDSKKAMEILDVKNWITKDFPPSFVMTSYYDFLRPNAPVFADLLAKNGIEYVLKLYGTAENKEAGHVFHVNIKHSLATVCNDEECDFFKKFKD